MDCGGVMHPSELSRALSQDAILNKNSEATEKLLARAELEKVRDEA